MRNGLPLVMVILLVVSLAGLAVFSAAMMATMMGSGHWNMMSRGGSDPASETPVAGVTDVRVADFAFSPASIVVEVGATVTWTNYDNVAHTVTGDAGDALDSPLFGRGETYSQTFEQSGTYPYYCKPHPNMKGLVTVVAAEGGA